MLTLSSANNLDSESKITVFNSKEILIAIALLITGIVFVTSTFIYIELSDFHIKAINIHVDPDTGTVYLSQHIPEAYTSTNFTFTSITG